MTRWPAWRRSRRGPGTPPRWSWWTARRAGGGGARAGRARRPGGAGAPPRAGRARRAGGGWAGGETGGVGGAAGARPGGGGPLPATAFVHLGALGRDAAAELVGPGRVDELYARSRGHPLFLTELAQQAAGSELPASLVESVSARCDELGPAGLLLRTAAVIGPDLDVDLLPAAPGRPAGALP